MNWQQHFARRNAQMKRSTVRELLKITAQPEMISFAGGLPAPELFPVSDVQRASDAVLIREGRRALQYGETEGAAELRDWIAARFSSDSRKFSGANVLVTSGAQQALDLIGRVLLDPADRVLVENPTYLALLSAWRPLGVDFVAVPGDADGLLVDALKRALVRQPKLLYTTPNFQNPQGTTLCLERRKQVVELLRAANVGIIEDDPYGDLRYSGQPQPRLLELDGNLDDQRLSVSNVVYVGTFSKVLAPGFRVGWVVAPEQVVDRMVRAKQAADLHTSTFSQLIAIELIRQGVLEKHLPGLIETYRERRDAMLAAMEQFFPSNVAWTRPEGGMFIFVTLPPSLDATAVLNRAIQCKVAFVPGEDFHADGHGKNTFRLNFTNATPAIIADGIGRLGNILRDLTSL
jgi:2-aminoadipate transaminase